MYGAKPRSGDHTGWAAFRTRGVIVANVREVKGGTYYPITSEANLRAQEIALHTRLPFIYLVRLCWRLPAAAYEVFPDREHFGTHL